jgi:hypothetical protein
LVDTELRFSTGLEVRMKRRVFSREFKVEAVKLIRQRGVAVAQAARDLDVAESICGVGPGKERRILGKPFLGTGRSSRSSKK